ncbi:MAG TPA: HAMP domain-containing sensor histidine kinase [Glaciihabitans sp.]|nr:HAMP domain-containing sensor histidine kinase [Glaciihabitans sp.]
MAKRSPTLRLRITAVATLIVGSALVVGALVLVVLLRIVLFDGLSTTADASASNFAQQVESSGLGVVPDDLDDDQVVQVLSLSGDIRAASEGADDRPFTQFLTTSDNDSVRIDGDLYVVAVEDAETPDGQEVLVIVGQSAEDVTDTLSTAIPFVLVAVLLVLAVVSATCWVVVGRALRPVDALRREVDAITASTLSARVHDPGTTDELGRLATTMNKMLGRLDDSQQTQRRFISDASHELKSPLASLRQYAEVAKGHPDRISATELADAVLDEGARLTTLVQNMLVLAHADEHALMISAHAVDLDDIVLAEGQRLKASTALRIDTSHVGAGRIQGDQTLLAQVVRNLADNAAVHAVGRVTMSLAHTGTSVTFSVEDDGNGIAVADRERVFDRFVRLDDARARDTGGSGLGLAIVKEIVVAHGGAVRLSESTLGGARIEVEFPAAKDS